MAREVGRWLCFGLKDAGLPVVCIEARHAKAAMVAMNRNKNDRNDARSLAQLVRSGRLKAVHVKPRPCQELRTLRTVRESCVNKLRDHENESRGLLRPFGLKVGKVGARDFEARAREVVVGNPLLKLCIHTLLAGREAMKKALADLHRALLRLAENDELCRRFMTRRARPWRCHISIQIWCVIVPLAIPSRPSRFTGACFRSDGNLFCKIFAHPPYLHRNAVDRIRQEIPHR